MQKASDVGGCELRSNHACLTLDALCIASPEKTMGAASLCLGTVYTRVLSPSSFRRSTQERKKHPYRGAPYAGEK